MGKALEYFRKDEVILIIDYSNKAWLLGMLDRLKDWKDVYLIQGDIRLSLNKDLPLYLNINEDLSSTDFLIPSDLREDLIDIYLKNLKSRPSKN